MANSPLMVLRVPEWLKAEVKTRARKKKITVSSVCRRAIYDGFDKRGLTKKEKAALRELLS